MSTCKPWQRPAQLKGKRKNNQEDKSTRWRLTASLKYWRLIRLKTSSGRAFHDRIVLGTKQRLNCWVLARGRPSWCSWAEAAPLVNLPYCTGTSVSFRAWLGLQYILYIIHRQETCLRCPILHRLVAHNASALVTTPYSSFRWEESAAEPQAGAQFSNRDRTYNKLGNKFLEFPRCVKDLNGTRLTILLAAHLIFRNWKYRLLNKLELVEWLRFIKVNSLWGYD